MNRKSILTQKQETLLKAFSASRFIIDNFYLTGGTALAEFYLGHRYSEDLDFFCDREFDILNLNIFFEKLKKNGLISKVDFQQSYNRNLFFVYFNDDVVKTEFTYFPFLRIEKGKAFENLAVDSILDIGVNKLFTIYQRTQARDFIDLYFICRSENYSIDYLIKKARIKFDWHIDPLQLGTQFVKAKEAKDLPRMIEKISDEEWHDFFISEAKKLKKDIL